VGFPLCSNVVVGQAARLPLPGGRRVCPTRILRPRTLLRGRPLAFVIPSEVEESLIVGFRVTAKIGHMKKIISTNEAPAAIGPYSQAVRSGSLLFCSGQIPLDPKSGQIVSGDITAQTQRVLDNIAAVLRAEGLSFDNVVKTTIFLTNLGDFQRVNEIYGSYFKQDPPARSTVQVSALPKGASVEIEVIAAVDETSQTAYDTSG
jgi:2-iminobutanoate/2-iminopropanoate deaminase